MAVIASEDGVGMACCERCGEYFNPREMEMISPRGSQDAYLGICGACPAEASREQREECQ